MAKKKWERKCKWHETCIARETKESEKRIIKKTKKQKDNYPLCVILDRD